MKIIHCPLRLNAAQAQFLQQLQHRFAQACNVVADIAQQKHVTARVALHHLAYETIRTQFPDLGAQLACNAIYAVARGYKQAQKVKVALGLTGDALPILRFSNTAPVFFDRHTLTLKPNALSLYTLEGRLQFQLDVSDEIIETLRAGQVKEAILQGDGTRYQLSFYLQAKDRTMPAALHPEVHDHTLYLNVDSHPRINAV